MSALAMRPAAASISPAVMSLPNVRNLSFLNIHTGESLAATYSVDGRAVPESLAEIRKVLRDYRNDAEHDIDVRLLDYLVALKHKTGASGPFHVISAYRSPETNNMLARQSSGVARHSLHMEGLAIDIRLPGHDLRAVRDAALKLKLGGVGYYPKSDFVHVDVGRVRHWG